MPACPFCADEEFSCSHFVGRRDLHFGCWDDHFHEAIAALMDQLDELTSTELTSEAYELSQRLRMLRPEQGGLNAYIDQLFADTRREVVATEYVDSPDVPGMNSTVRSYWSETPSEAMREAANLVRQDIERLAARG